MYFHRIKELSVLKHIVIPAAASIFFAVILYYSMIPITYPLSYGTFIVFIWAIIGIIIALIVKKERIKKSSLFFSYEAKNESKEP